MRPTFPPIRWTWVAACLVAGLSTAAAYYPEWKSGIEWPEPPVIEPGQAGGPPSDAIVLFGGEDLSAWEGGDKWTIEDGVAIDGGNITSRRLRDGNSIGFTYDALGRPTFKDLPGSEPDVTFGYDLLGRLTSASQPGRTFSFTWDALGRQTGETTPLGTFASDYDAAGRRTRLTWPGSGLSDGQHCLPPVLSWQVEPRGQSAFIVHALPQNFCMRFVSSMQLSPAPPHSLSATQPSQKLLSGRQARIEGSQ